MNILSKSMIVLAAITLCGCATPHVVQKTKLTDNKLTCQQLKQQVTEADNYEKRARDDRKINSTNVAALVLAPIALVGTYSNTQEAIDAARDRKEHLSRLYDKKGC